VDQTPNPGNNKDLVPKLPRELKLETPATNLREPNSLVPLAKKLIKPGEPPDPKKVARWSLHLDDQVEKMLELELRITCNKICLVAQPAQYKKVPKRVVAKPASTRKIKTPAKYTTVRIKKLIQPATTRTIPIPAKYKTVTKKKKIAEV